MKIGYNTWWIDENRAGISNYSYHLIKNLIKIGKSDSLFLYHNKKGQDEIYRLANELINPISCPKPFNSIGLPITLKRERIDIFHSLAPFYSDLLPLWLNLALKNVVTIHDITTILYPETFNKKDVLLWDFTIKAVLKKCDVFIADSYNTKQDCIKHLHIQEDNIQVIPLAVDKIFKPIIVSEELKREIAAKYGIEYPYILYVGTLEGRKNITTLINAYAKLRKAGINHKLVIAGRKGWKYADIFTAIERNNLQNDIIFTGFVEREELPLLYNLADVFAYPSLYEGFGIPPLEAMACGTPVVVSNSSSLPEVVGDAGILIDPYNVDELSSALLSIISDKTLQNELKIKGMNKAREFSWEKTAKETWSVYEQLMLD